MRSTYPYESWRIYKLKRRVRLMPANTSRPLASLWRDNETEFDGIPVGLQLDILQHWAESIYGKEEARQLELAERTEALITRSIKLYQGRSMDASKQPVTLSNPLRVVMGELNC
ncbi:MAG: hypothetical protein KTR32_30300 [Granulosicoccus sp.]|nr:hypothetical protein [Granulosicoccus sp.]